MSTESSLVSLIAAHPILLQKIQKAGITEEHFPEGPWRNAYRWVLKMKREHAAVPSAEMIENRYKVELHTTASRSLPILISQLQEQKKFYDFTEAIDEAARHAGGAAGLDDAMGKLQQEMNRLSLVNGANKGVVDAFSPEVQQRMQKDYMARRRGEAKGMPTGLRRIDSIIGGLHKRRMAVVMARSGIGKAQPLTAKVMTPDGEALMGELKVGDLVLCPDGTQAPVTAIHPRGEMEIFKVTTSDGGFTYATADHLWLTQSQSKERRYGRPGSIRTTKEIAESIFAPSVGKWEHYLPLTKPFSWPDKNLTLDPYVLGALIGDGCFVNSAATRISLSEEKRPLAEYISLVLPKDCKMQETPNTPNTYSFSRTIRERGWYSRKNFVTQSLIDLKLNGLLSHEKFVPNQYLFASAETRLGVLQGLLDTDGSPLNASAEYCTTSPQLADDVVWIVRSLGGVAKTKWRYTWFTHNGEKKGGRRSARVYITLPAEMIYFPHVPAKQAKINTKNQKTGRSVRTIRSVESAGTQRVQCITVDHPENLYITDDWIVTHNSFMDLLFITEAVLSGHKCILFPLEMTLEETAYRLFTIFSNRLWGEDQALKNLDLTMGRVTPRKVVKLMGILEDRFAGQLYIADVASMADPYTVERVEAEIVAHQPDLGWIDYIQLMKGPAGRDKVEDHTTVKVLSNGVAHIAKRHNCAMGVSAQVNREALKKAVFLPRIENISGGDAIGCDADLVISMNRRDQEHIFYAVVKNRHGPEINRTRVKFGVNTGAIRETEEQPSDEDD